MKLAFVKSGEANEPSLCAFHDEAWLRARRLARLYGELTSLSFPVSVPLGRKDVQGTK